MDLTVITIFPELIAPITSCGVVGRAFANQLAQLQLLNPRDYTSNKHRNVDSRPFGGGPGMVMQVEPLVACLEAARARLTKAARVIYLSPQGTPLTQAIVAKLVTQAPLILVAGRYEGVDQRFIDHWVDEEISVGDYVVSGGELPAMLLIDAMVRLIPGALGDAESTTLESFNQHPDHQSAHHSAQYPAQHPNGIDLPDTAAQERATVPVRLNPGPQLLDHPHYARPVEFRGHRVPDILLSGDHALIKQWRYEQAVKATKIKRPDLLQSG